MPESVPDFKTLLERFEAEEARVVLIGGLAMIAHGSTRVTFDMDVSFARDRENVGRIVRALAPLNPRPRGFPEDLPFVWSETTLRSLSTVTLRTTAGNLDLLAEPAGVESFEGLWTRAVDGDVAGRRAKVASIGDLDAMKRAAGRPKDIDDLHFIEAIREEAERLIESRSSEG